MPLWFAAVLGLVQGLTEFIPVSSTAHLRLVPALFDQPDAGAAYTAVIQLGTLLAVIVYFARDLARLPRALVVAPRSPEGRLPWLLLIGTLPIVIAGVALRHVVERDLRSLTVVATALFAVGALLVLVDRRTNRRGTARALANLSVAQILTIGCAQAIALVPGVSRSGATISMGLLLGFSRTESARISFLLSIPALAGAGVFELHEAIRSLGPTALPALVMGTAVAAITGYASIAWLLRWLGSHQLVGFGVYRIILGVVVFVGALTGRLA